MVSMMWICATSPFRRGCSEAYLLQKFNYYHQGRSFQAIRRTDVLAQVGAMKGQEQ